jgi:hypothetical protein
MLKNCIFSAILLSSGLFVATGCSGKMCNPEKSTVMAGEKGEMKAIHEELECLKETKSKYMHRKRHFEREAMRLQYTDKLAAKQYQQFILRLDFLADEVQKEIDKLEAEKGKIKSMNK